MNWRKSTEPATIAGCGGASPKITIWNSRDRIQPICLAHHRHYGYCRASRELRRAGLVANAKRLRRIMRSDKLSAVRRKKFVVTPPPSIQHPLSVFPNLAAVFRPTGINQVWVADLTYIRLRREFVYSCSLPGCAFTPSDRGPQ